MGSFFSRRMLACYFGAGLLLWPLPGLAQRGSSVQSLPNQTPDPLINANLMVLVRDETGGANSLLALVQISRMEGGMFNQGTTEVGQVQFEGVPTGVYTVKVTAAGYREEQQTVNVNGGIVIVQFQLRPDAEAMAASARPPGLPVLAPKAQKLLDEVWKDLRENKLENAHASLDKLQQLAPSHPDVDFAYGMYEAHLNEPAKAKVYWRMTLELYPKHFGALLQLSQAALRENKPGEAVPLLNTALEVGPGSWRAHAMMAQAHLEQREFPEAVKEGDRALELGHNEADGVEPLLARALVAAGNKERAIEVLQHHLKAHPDHSDAQKMLDALRVPEPEPSSAGPKQGNPPAAPPVE